MTAQINGHYKESVSVSGKSSHGQIIRSSALIGGSSFVGIVVGLVRVKFAAVYLGPLGVGLFGAYSSILSPLGTLAGLGLNNTGVRQIAEAVAQDDQVRISRTLKTVRRTAMVTGLLGMFLMLFLSYPLSVMTFGDATQAKGLCILSVTILLAELSGGLGAIIQGMRRIKDLALQGILGAVISLPIAILLMIWMGVNGLIPMMIASSFVSITITWWFSKRIRTVNVPMTLRETWIEAQPLLKLGFVIMSASLTTAATAYIQRVLIIRMLGIEANGIYSSAWVLSNYYVSIIIAAMGADFYPRLTAVNHNNKEVNRLVNEQTEVGLLMALPGVIATMSFAPVIIHLFYSPKFLPAVEILRWHILGLVLRLITWPMGYIMLAKGEKGWFFWTELISNVVTIAFLWLGVKYFGLIGTGIAFFALYTYYLGVTLVVSHKLTSFRWEKRVLKLVFWSGFLLLIIFFCVHALPEIPGSIIGGGASALVAWLCLRELTRLTGKNLILAATAKLTGIIPRKWTSA